MIIKLYNLFITNWFGIKGRASRTEYICRFLMMWFLGYIIILIMDEYQSTDNLLIGLPILVLFTVFII